MKKYLFLILTSILSMCCGRPPEVRVDPVTKSEADTVALVIEMPFNGMKVRPFCSGVWIGDEWILTARHCTLTDGDEDKEEKYIASAEGTPKVYTAQVAYRSEDHDLALLRIITGPAHGWAKIALKSPRQGANVHVVGHPLGFWYTYLTGTVAGYRERIDGIVDTGGPKGPYLQIEAPIFHGNSGGGAFNDDNELVGICSFSAGLPSEGFFIPVEAITPFVMGSHL